MSEKEKQILETLGNVLPKLNEVEREKLLSFGEGMAFVKSGTADCIKEVKSK